MNAVTLLVFATAVGAVTGGMGITIAHELAHRASLLDRVIAKMLLVSVCYGHFTVEHIRGHHARVGTPEDPATAPRGMNVYQFLLRSVLGSLAHAAALIASAAAIAARMRAGVAGMSIWVIPHP